MPRHHCQFCRLPCVGNPSLNTTGHYTLPRNKIDLSNLEKLHQIHKKTKNLEQFLIKND
jgi:hypothetical protein